MMMSIIVNYNTSFNNELDDKASFINGFFRFWEVKGNKNV
jgi:hypothetical protein